MQKFRYKHAVVSLLLMTFAGQALASALSCCENLPFRNTTSSQLEHPISGLAMPGTNVPDADLSGYYGLITDTSMLADSSDCSTTAKAPTINHSSHLVSPSVSDNWHSLMLPAILGSASATDCSLDCDCSASGQNPVPTSASQAVFAAGFMAPENGYTIQPQDQLVTAVFRPPISR